jgi:hypothetical protein
MFRSDLIGAFVKILSNWLNSESIKLVPSLELRFGCLKSSGSSFYMPRPEPDLGCGIIILDESPPNFDSSAPARLYS